MKKLILFLISTLFLSCGSSEIDFNKDLSFEEVINQAKSEKKPLFVEIMASDCHICIALETHLKDAEVAKIYNSNFINYKIDIKDPLQYNLLKNFKVNFTGTPTLLILNPENMELIGGSIVNESEDGKLALLATANFYLKYGDLNSIQGDFSNYSKEELLTLAELARLGYKDALAAKAFKEFSIGLSEEEMMSEANMDIIGRVMISVDNDYFAYFLNNYEVFTQKFGPMRVEPVMSYILQNAINSSNSENYGQLELERIRKGLEKLGVSLDDITRRMWMIETNYLFKNQEDSKAIAILNKTVDLMDSKPNERIYAYLCDYVKKRTTNPTTLNFINKNWCK